MFSWLKEIVSGNTQQSQVQVKPQEIQQEWQEVKKPQQTQKPQTPRELLLAEAKSCISAIAGSVPWYEASRIRGMYEKLEFISDEKAELICVDFSLAFKQKNEALSLSLKKYKHFEEIPDDELRLYIKLLEQELREVISPLRNDLVRQNGVTGSLRLGNKEYYKTLNDEIAAKLNKYQFSWASLHELKEFNKKIAADKEKIDANEKEILLKKFAAVVDQGVAVAGEDVRLRKWYQEALLVDSKTQKVEDLEGMITFLEGSIARKMKKSKDAVKEPKPAISVPSISNNSSVMYGSSPRNKPVLQDPASSVVSVASCVVSSPRV